MPVGGTGSERLLENALKYFPWKVPGLRAKPLLGFALLALAVSCAGSEPGTPTPDAMARVLRDYVGALSVGDYGRAIAMRCRDRAVTEEQRPQFEDEVRRLLAEAAPIEVADAGPLLGSDARGVRRVSYHLGTRHGVSEPMVADVLNEDDGLRLCGWTPLAVVKGERLPPELAEVDAGQLPGVRELVDIPPAEGTRQVEDGPVERDHRSKPDEIEGWTRTWQRGEYGGSRLTAIRYSSAEAALSAGRSYLQEKRNDVVVTFAPPVAGGAGLRVMASAWLGIQAPDIGPFVDFAYAVRNDVLISAVVANLPRGSDHRAVHTLLREAVDKIPKAS